MWNDSNVSYFTKTEFYFIKSSNSSKKTESNDHYCILFFHLSCDKYTCMDLSINSKKFTPYFEGNTKKRIK